MYSLLIRNGTVIDSEKAEEERLDLAVEGDKIVRIGPEISGEAVCELDAEGCMVTPGLIDHHAHIYPMAKIGIPGEAVCFSSGVTTVVDAGSTGCDTYESYLPFRRMLKMGLKSYLNICSVGLASLPDSMEDVAPDRIDKEAIKRIFDWYGEELLGLKLRISRDIVKELRLEPLRAASELGKELGVPLMVHITDPPEPLEEVFKLLRPKDVVTHMYQNTGHTILANEKASDAKVSAAAWKVRERGILFEAADARAHFSFEVGEVAIKEGFLPDLLGTDLTKFSMYARPTAFNMAMQISKYTYLGIPFAEVIRRCAWNPAVEMGIHQRTGSLREGKQADIAVFRPCRKKNLFGDRPYQNENCSLREGTTVFEPVLTVKNGEMVYRNVTF